MQQLCDMQEGLLEGSQKSFDTTRFVVILLFILESMRSVLHQPCCSFQGSQMALFSEAYFVTYSSFEQIKPICVILISLWLSM